MPDLETLLDRLDALTTYLAELDYYAQFSLEEFTHDFVKFRAVQHSLQLTAQVIVDISAHIITADFQSRVQEYRETIWN